MPQLLSFSSWQHMFSHVRLFSFSVSKTALSRASSSCFFWSGWTSSIRISDQIDFSPKVKRSSSERNKASSICLWHCGLAWFVSELSQSRSDWFWWEWNSTWNVEAGWTWAGGSRTWRSSSYIFFEFCGNQRVYYIIISFEVTEIADQNSFWKLDSVLRFEKIFINVDVFLCKI